MFHDRPVLIAVRAQRGNGACRKRQRARSLLELIAPLVAVLKAVEIELQRVEAMLASLAERDPIIGL